MGLNRYLLIGLVALSAKYVIASEKVVMCYYGTWATYRWGNGKFDVEHLNPLLCTHIVYSFVGINHQGTVISLDPHLDLPDSSGKDNFGKFKGLKQVNPNLKTILAVGGWNEGSGKYSVMAADPALRKNFITSALQMVLNYDFDGFDLDWEYPNRRDTVHGAADIDNFTQLVKELKEEFDKHGLLITAAVSAVKDSAALSYNIPELSKYLDFIGLMSYDMYGAWDPVTGHNAPLYRGEGDENAARDSLYTVDVAVEYWIEQGCPSEKLLIGLPFYGRTFTLANANVNGVRAPSVGAGIAGPFTVTSGSVGYNEFCDMLRTQTWDIRYDSLAKVPYAIQGNNWVSYDDAASITEKVEFGLKNNLGGVMLWSIETDDFHGICTGEDYPLLRAINRALGRDVSGSISTTTTQATTTTAGTTTTTAATTTTTTSSGSTASVYPSSTTIAASTTTEATTEQPVTSVCKAEGYAAHPDDCSSFYMCHRGLNGELIPSQFGCPGILLWDQQNLYCNYPDLVNCV